MTVEVFDLPAKMYKCCKTTQRPRHYRPFSKYLSILSTHETMSAPSIIVIGAGGYLGGLVTKEILADRLRFNRIAILTNESKKQKFSEHQAKGFELVLGAFDSPESFKGST